MKTVYTLILCFMMAVSYSQETTIYIIRHAEKAGNEKDSGLTSEGKERAEKWANYFSDKNITALYFTAAKPTVDTGMPTLRILNTENSDKAASGSKTVKTEVYDPAKVSLSEIAKKNRGKNILIVGHSNTIASTINKLIGEDKYNEIKESEYDNLYIIKISGDKISHEVQKI